ncbi:hypothetical protein [Aliikangiella maris]|uniref:Uncharacterized protein n=2 Tax=Aliikangiella maris TaxID=3162458 RepID=A0ABV3MJ09_9GAMM
MNSINSAIDKAGLTREDVVKRMNKTLGDKPLITINRFNKWLAPSSERDFPMMFLPALCWAVSSVSIIDVLLSPIQFKAADPQGQNLQLAAQHLKLAKELREKAEALMALKYL